MRRAEIKNYLNEIQNKISVYSISSSLGLIKGDLPTEPVYMMAGNIVGKSAAGFAKTFNASEGIGINAFENPDEDDFVVVASDTQRVIWGGIGSSMIQNKKGRGVIVDGGMIGVEAAKGLIIPTYYRYASSATHNHIYKCHEDCEVTLDNGRFSCGVSVSPGDIIVADREGIVIIEPENLEEVIGNARYVEVIAQFVWGVHGGRDGFSRLKDIPEYYEFWKMKGRLPDVDEVNAYLEYYKKLIEDPKTREDVRRTSKNIFGRVLPVPEI